MKWPFCNTPNAQPGDSDLSHSAKILSTFGFAGNCWAARAVPISVGASTIVRQRRTEIPQGLAMFGLPMISTVGRGKHVVLPYGRPVASTPLGKIEPASPLNGIAHTVPRKRR